jgi:hypothetical protein
MLKQIVVCALLVLSLNLSLAQENNSSEKAPVLAKVDPRVELMAILAHMAGLGGYDSKVFKVYLDDVKKHFEKDSAHPAVKHLKELGKKHHLGFDAVMRMAIHLDYPSLIPKVKFSPSIPEPRWTQEGAEKFIPLLKQFFEDTNFDNFFRSHKELYAVAEKRFQVLLNQADYDWFPRFYGYKPASHFSVYPGLLNGGISYGPKVEYPDGKEEFYAIMATYKTDSAGMPVYEQGMLSTVVHEFNHSFINHLIVKDSIAIKPYGEKIYEPVKNAMKNNFYPHWIISLQESIVRAAVIRYKIEHDTTGKEVLAALADEYNRGFIWIDELVSLLGIYENSRDQYKTFASFMPVIKAYFKDLANNMDYRYSKYSQKIPKVLTTYPIVNGATDVDPSVKELTIIFNKPLGSGWSFRYSDLGKEHYPIESIVGWDETNSQLKIKLNLKPNWNYEMIIMSQGLRSKEGFAVEDLLFKFKTK